jgi:hypothetical protein
MAWLPLNFNTTPFAKIPECLKVIELVFEWVGNDDSGPEDVRMMRILSVRR